MIDILINVTSFVIAIGLLVAIHEFGHFWVARKLGVKVLRFSIGFGKPIWQKKGLDGVEYQVAAIPLGGYVKMLDESEAPVPADEEHLAFNRKPVGHRMAVVLAGPAFNFLFALAAYWLVLVTGISGLKPVMGEIPPDTVAARAGLQIGDEIISVDGKETPALQVMSLRILDHLLARESVPVTVRDEQGHERELMLDMTDQTIQADPERFLEMLGMTVFQPEVPAEIGELVKAKPAEKAGLQVGDVITSAAGSKVSDWMGFVEIVRARPDEPVPLIVKRGEQQLSLILTPDRVIDPETGENYGQIGVIVAYPEGAYERLRVNYRYGPLEAVGQSITKTWDMSMLTLQMLWKMVVGQVSWKNISGPVNIAQYAGYTAQIGFVSFMSFLAVVSISLGVLNLLPIPILDGGHFLYYLIEWMKGSPVSYKVQQVGQQLGIVALMMLMTVAFYNDINRLFG